MQYQTFINTIKCHETENVTALSYNDCCSLESFPPEFIPLLGEIVRLLDESKELICGETNCKIAIIGMQIIPRWLASKTAYKTRTSGKNYHLCYLISYLLIGHNQEKPRSWSHQETLVVDFTTGEIMDNDRYFSLAFGESKRGCQLGTIPQKQLDIAWVMKNKNNRQPIPAVL